MKIVIILRALFARRISIRRSFTTLVIFFLSTPSHAIFCPNNFKQINLGDTMDQVKAQCGAPAKEETKPGKDFTPQEWTYYMPMTVMMNTNTNGQGTMKVSMSFDNNDKAINITANGIGVGATAVCGTNVQLGASKDDVKSACGKPNFINKQIPPDTSPEALKAAEDANKITEYTYIANPPVVLVFEGGVLTGKK